jgi:short-subunit dehydrogenase
MGKYIVIGGSKGIGSAIVNNLLENHEVINISRTEPQSTHANLTHHNCDIVSDDLPSIDNADGLVYCPGSINLKPINRLSIEDFKSDFEINVIKAVLPKMREQHSGLIINITSIAGYMGLPYRGIYSASKGALELLTEAFRMELKNFNIKMTNVAPGDFATNIAAGRYHAPTLDNSPYMKPYGDTLDLMNTHVDNGSNPDMMAKSVYRIINTPNPKGHYKVGEFMQKFSIVLKRILPDKVYEKLLMKHYKL